MMAAICLNMWIPTFNMFYSSKKGRYDSNQCSGEQDRAVKHHIQAEAVTAFDYKIKIGYNFCCSVQF